MNNLSCVCVNIFSQLSQLLTTFGASQTSSSTFTHTGGFGDGQMPQSTLGLGQDGRMGGSPQSSEFAMTIMLVFALVLLFFGTG
jgi:hypothetical protein